MMRVAGRDAPAHLRGQCVRILALCRGTNLYRCQSEIGTLHWLSDEHLSLPEVRNTSTWAGRAKVFVSAKAVFMGHPQVPNGTPAFLLLKEEESFVVRMLNGSLLHISQEYLIPELDVGESDTDESDSDAMLHQELEDNLNNMLARVNAKRLSEDMPPISESLVPYLCLLRPKVAMNIVSQSITTMFARCPWQGKPWTWQHCQENPHLDWHCIARLAALL
jgi:hypothetical protein